MFDYVTDIVGKLKNIHNYFELKAIKKELKLLSREVYYGVTYEEGIKKTSKMIKLVERGEFLDSNFKKNIIDSDKWEKSISLLEQKIEEDYFYSKR